MTEVDGLPHASAVSASRNGAEPVFDVGVIGLGTMGGAIAKNLSRAGLRICGYDVDAGRVAEFEAAGGVACIAAENLAAIVPLILTSLPSPAALDSTVSAIAVGVERRPAGDRPLVAEMSTLAEADKQAAADRLRLVGVPMIDAPVSGTGIQAERGDLVIYASGDDASVDQFEATFNAMARRVVRVGPFGIGMRTKLVANLLVAVHIVAAAEALNLARAAGLDLPETLAALVDGAGGSRMLEVRGPMMVDPGSEPPSMTLRLFAKDEQLIREYAASLGVEATLFEEASRLLRRASNGGRQEQDTSAVYFSLVESTLPSAAPVG
jgi:3-hydroxyisobutyrate dehydrogenase-like beta-hydroxyacid dehydrogenase